MALTWRLGRLELSCGCCKYPEVLAIVVLSSLIGGLFGDLSAAFLRSIVDCTHLVPDEAGKCQVGFSVVEGRCQPKPTDAWSGSKHCPNADYVMNQGVHMTGQILIAGLVGNFIALFVVGPLIDIWGRKPVIMLTIFGDIVNICCVAWVASMVTARIMLLLLPAAFVAGATNAIGPAMNAMASDLSQATVGGRTTAFSVLKFANNSAAIVAIGLGFWMLGLRLTNYFQVWTIMAVATVFSWVLAGVLLRETLPFDISDPSLKLGGDSSTSDRSAVCCRGWRMTKEVTRLVRNDRFLINFIVVQFFIVAAFGIAEAVARPFLISHLGYSQACASLVGVVLNAAALTGNAASNVLIRRFGPLLVYGASTVVRSLGFCIQGLAGLVPCADAAFWSGMVLVGLGFGVADTAGTVLLSLRVRPEAMGVMCSLERGLGLAGNLVGVFMGTHYLFDARATGWRKSWGFSMCSIFLFLGVVWYFAAYYILEAVEDMVTTDSDEVSSEISEETPLRTPRALR